MLNIENVQELTKFIDAHYSHWDWRVEGLVYGLHFHGLARLQCVDEIFTLELRRSDWHGYWPKDWTLLQSVDRYGAFLRIYLDPNTAANENNVGYFAMRDKVSDEARGAILCVLHKIVSRMGQSNFVATKQRSKLMGSINRYIQLLSVAK